MQYGRVFFGVHKLRDPRENKARRSSKRLVLQLPDPVHQNVARPHRSANQTARSLAAADFKGLADVADQHRIAESLVRRRMLSQVPKNSDAQVVEDAAIGVN